MNPVLLSLLAATLVAGDDTPPRGLRLNDPQAFQGYTLFAPLLSGTTFLIDMQGVVVHKWVTDAAPMSVELLENGHLLRMSRINENPVFFGGGIGGRIQELDKDGQVLWEFVLTDAQRCMHHDIERLPNGNVLAIAWEFLSRDEAIALGRDAEQTDGRGFWPDCVLEIEPTRPSGGKIVWEWHAKDHFVQDRDPKKPGFGKIAEHVGRFDINFRPTEKKPPANDEEKKKQDEAAQKMRALGYAGGDAEDDEEDTTKPKPAGPTFRWAGDWMHTNAVHYDATSDLIALSSPRFSEIFVIDHSTTTAEARTEKGGRYGKGGALLYRYGNPQNYGLGTEADRRLFEQHDCQWIPAGSPGAGNMTVFNNGGGRADKEYSSVDEIVLPFDAKRGFARDAKSAFGPKELAWTYTDPENFYAPFISGCQRLANGNTLICEGPAGRFFEVTSAGKIVWEYLNPFGGEIPPSFGSAAPKDQPAKVEPIAAFRVTRIAKDHPGLAKIGVK
ncbi:MAG: aryl-sulfate sulfotransferase [Planctomycetota bacterium]